jgi:protein SCO1/2
VMVCLGIWSFAGGSEKTLPVYKDFPEFDAEAATSDQLLNLKKSDLVGHPFVADFIYTTCPGPCPIMSHKMSDLQKRLPVPILLVSFTVDPDTDTPLVLQQYARQYRAEARRWYFVRPRKSDLLGFLEQVFPSSSKKAPQEMGHSTQFVLVDAHGQIRGYYDKNLMDLPPDIRHLN